MIRPKTTIELRMTGTAVHHARTDLVVRDLTAIIDEPVARGGTNAGITPTETLLSSLVGCTNVITQRIARRDGVQIADMTIGAVCKLDRRGAAMEEEIEVPFQTITLTIDIATDATDAQMAVIKTDLGRFCPIAKVLRAAGTQIEETWNVRAL
ncbi:MAG TPA: OsmC family protein [Paracoccaceae bacterium]|nr:OsmC family protein [Paracoccaceae bacterium]